MMELPEGTYTVSLSIVDIDGDDSGDLDFATPTAPTDLVGAGADVTTIDAARIDRVIAVSPGTTVSILGVTITHGITGAAGGGINNQGTLALTHAVVTENHSQSNGDRIVNRLFETGTEGSLTLGRTTVANNLRRRDFRRKCWPRDRQLDDRAQRRGRPWWRRLPRHQRCRGHGQRLQHDDRLQRRQPYDRHRRFRGWRVYRQQERHRPRQRWRCFPAKMPSTAATRLAAKTAPAPPAMSARSNGRRRPPTGFSRMASMLDDCGDDDRRQSDEVTRKARTQAPD